jgi:predicted house-cleaning noncanonical NTP pyrophosphatase (MazG superfamily)
MAREREAADREQSREFEKDTPQQDSRTAAQQRALHSVRRELKAKVTSEYRETVMDSLLVFRQMLDGDTEAAIRESMKPELLHKLGEKLVDKIKDKLLESMKDGLDLGKRLSGYMTVAFDGIKGKLTSITDTNKKLTAIDLVQHLNSAVYEAMATFTDKAASMVDSLGDDEIVDIYRILAPTQKASVEDDAEATQLIRHGLRNWVLEDKLGLPHTGGAEVHLLAQRYYLEFHAELRATMPVHEQVDDIKDLSYDKTEEKATEAEGKIGPHMQESVKKDQMERQWVASLS